MLGLWPEAPSWTRRQDGDPVQGEPESRAKENGGAYGLDGTPRTETGGVRNGEPEGEAFQEQPVPWFP